MQRRAGEVAAEGERVSADGREEARVRSRFRRLDGLLGGSRESDSKCLRHFETTRKVMQSFVLRPELKLLKLMVAHELPE